MHGDLPESNFFLNVKAPRNPALVLLVGLRRVGSPSSGEPADSALAIEWFKMRKSVNYIIQPSTAKPYKIRQLRFGDVYDFELDHVEQAALRETLRTTSAPNPFSSFINGFLVPYSSDLIWIGDGPGTGREMRRAFSAIFGRFFARAYLTDCHGFVWFAPLDGPRQVVSARLQVNSGGPRQDLPDWI
jgi:hypothetical protein